MKETFGLVNGGVVMLPGLQEFVGGKFESSDSSREVLGYVAF